MTTTTRTLPLAPPSPYRILRYALPTAPLTYAHRIRMSDGALLAAFVYGNLYSAQAPVLALHGNGGTHAAFSTVIDRLVAAGLTVVAFDARAQGQSTRGTVPLTYEQMAADAVAVLDHLGIAEAHVVGHSDGGIESLLLARDYPARVLSIVAGGANLTPEGVIDEWDTERSARINRVWASWMQAAETEQATHADNIPYAIDLSLLPSAEDVLLSAELLQLMLDEPHIEAASLSSISCPACVLVGEHDCITTEETHAIAEAIPGARLVVVPDVGHSLPRMAPDAVALQVLTNVLLASR